MGLTSFSDAIKRGATLTDNDGAEMQLTDLGLPIPVSASGSRTELSGNTTYYIRTDGNDSNSGTTNTSGGAWLTLQHAINYIVASLDFAGYTVTIQIGDGTYTGATSISSGWTGGGALIIQGNATTPTNVSLSTSSAHAISISAGLPGTLTIQNLQVKTTTSGIGITHSGAGTVCISGIDFGACADGHFCAEVSGAIIFVTGNYTISGGTISSSPLGYHMGAFHGGYIQENSITVTISGSPSVSEFAHASQCAVIQSTSCTFTGTITCVRYFVPLNGVINTGGVGGPNYFPGTTAGSTGTGGQYD